MIEYKRIIAILLAVMTIIMVVVVVLAVYKNDFNRDLETKAVSPQTQDAQPSPKNVPNLTGADEGTLTLDKDGFTELVATNIEGAVTEIDKANSFLRIYDTRRSLIYTVFVSPTTIFIEKEKTVSFTDIGLGDAIRATSNISQSAFEFHADSVTIVSHQVDQFPIFPSVQKIPL